MSLRLSKAKCINVILDFNMNSNIENLFFITNFGQMNHITGLIKYLNLEKCFLIVLYTEANFYIPQTIHDSVEEDIFESVYFHQIPKFPNKIDVKLALLFKKEYSKILNYLQPDHLYLNSFQFHYSILATVAKKKGIELILVEEGLGTYRLGGIPDEGKVGHLTSSKIKNISKKTVGNTQVFKKIYKNFKETKKFIRESQNFIVQLYKTPELQACILKLLPDKEIKSVLSPYLDYDKSYTSFPVVSEKIFNIRENNFYFSHDEVSLEELKKANEIIKNYGFSNNDYVYLSQQYSINDFEYVNIICEELLKIIKDTKSRVFIKLHPRNERPNVIQAFKAAEMESLGKIIVIKESDFRIESAIKEAQVKGVIGLTSTGLVYTSIIYPECKIYSLAEILVKRLDSSKNLKGMKMIEDHTKIIKQFENIIFL